jgi:VanZ family protein
MGRLRFSRRSLGGSDGHESLVVLFWPTSDLQSAAVVWLVQVLTSLGVAPSLATFSRLDVLMNAVIVAAVSVLGSMAFSRLGWRAWPDCRFVAAVLIETIQGVLRPVRPASFADVVANTAGMLLGDVLYFPICPMLRQG